MLLKSAIADFRKREGCGLAPVTCSKSFSVRVGRYNPCVKEGHVERSHPATKLTYADYLQFPDDNLRHEIIGGEHFVTPSPVIRHQQILGNLHFLLRQHLENEPRGELFLAPSDLLLSEFDIVVPDLMYLSRERRHFLTAKNLQGPPDLVVEILSPGTRSRDLRLKRDLYERTGVAEYWIVDPIENAVTICRRSDTRFQEPVRLSTSEGDVLTTPLLPHLEIPLARLFASPYRDER